MKNAIKYLFGHNSSATGGRKPHGSCSINLEILLIGILTRMVEKPLALDSPRWPESIAELMNFVLTASIPPQVRLFCTRKCSSKRFVH